MDRMTILYIIAGLNGATLLAVIAGTVEVFKWRRKRDRSH